jgi:hypothetical protein
MVQTVTAFSERRPVSSPRQFRMRLLVSEVARTHIGLRVFRFFPVSTIPLMLCTHLCLNINLIRWTRRRIRGTFKQKLLFVA